MRHGRSVAVDHVVVYSRQIVRARSEEAGVRMRFEHGLHVFRVVHFLLFVFGKYRQQSAARYNTAVVRQTTCIITTGQSVKIQGMRREILPPWMPYHLYAYFIVVKTSEKKKIIIIKS